MYGDEKTGSELSSFYFFFFFETSVSQCSSGYPGICYVDQALIHRHPSASAAHVLGLQV